jgi:hypothetical protein
MFNSGILDVVIGVVVLYLELSLVCTAVHELIALLLKARAKELEKGLHGLLTKRELVDRFYDHPLIKGLQPDKRRPSYIPSRTFSLALMDIVRRHSFDGRLAAAAQDVTAKTAVRDSARTTSAAATAALAAAQSVNRAAAAALAAAGVADKLQASKDVQQAAIAVTAAQAAGNDALAKLNAAEQAVTEATNYLAQLQTDAANANQAEADAQSVETLAKENPQDVDLQKRAVANRQKANSAAHSVAPTASSLLSDARDKVASVQSDVVPEELKTSLLALMDNAGTNLNKAQANLEQWFDDAMDRVSGVYKRKSHKFVVAIALLVTVLANVDTLQVADSLSHDKALRETLVAAAPELAKADAREAEVPSPTPVASPVASPTAGANSNPAATPTPTPTPTPLPTPSLSTIKASLDELKKFGLPIGYIRVCTATEERFVDNCRTTVQALVRETEAELKKAEDNLKKADANLKIAADKLEKPKSDFKTAQDKQGEANSDNLKATDENKASTQAALSKAQTDLEKAQTDLTKAQTDVENAQKARDDSAAKLTKAQDNDKAAQDRFNKVKLVETTLSAAEKAAREYPKDEEKQKAAYDARLEAAAITGCPKCRKESELTTNEMKRRLPTTHGYSLLSKDFPWDLHQRTVSEEFPKAVGALFWDSVDLLYTHWLGWALTAFAISLGAPFWFDSLNKLMVVRSTVKPHEKSKEQESKDNPDEKDETKKT